MRARRLRAAALLAALLGPLAGPAAHATALRHCGRQGPISAAEQDQALRFAAAVKAELDAAGQPAVLVSRSGMDLGWLGLRFSHAGLSLRDSPAGAWTVRQLYFDCEAGEPRVFDQGMAGFVLGTDDRRSRHVSLVFLPPEAARALAKAASRAPAALAVLAADYSANAYAWGVRYQNCNQWVAELMAVAWGGLPLGGQGAGEGQGEGEGDGGATAPTRRRAQAWLRDAGYAPMVFDMFPPLRLASAFVPWLHEDDHPPADRARARYRVSMPDALEAFVRTRWPEARRVELCHGEGRLVVQRGWTPIAEGCLPAPPAQEDTP